VLAREFSQEVTASRFAAIYRDVVDRARESQTRRLVE
jgi:hypothetical protein